MFLKIFLAIALLSCEILGIHINSIIFSEHFDQCGVMSTAAGLVQGGNYSTQTQFPWIAIISINNDGTWDQNGSGSLISRRHVLVKSRYVSTIDDDNMYIPISPEDIQIYLGTTKYADLSQEGSVKIGVTRINLYPNSRKIIDGFSLYNFAILTLESDVTFSDYIKPICLWTNDLNSRMYSGQTMIAVGYGKDLTGEISKERKHVAVQVTSTADCETEYERDLLMVHESRFFCVKGNDGLQGPCKFDTQLYVKVDSAWYLRGEMIAAAIDPDTRVCLVSYPIAVEDIAPYVEWIDDQIKSELIEIFMQKQKYGILEVIDVENVVNNRIE